MSAYSKASYFWRSAGSGLRHAPFVHFISVLTIAIALFAVGLARGGGRLLDGMLGALGGEVEVTVYLEPELGVAHVEALRRGLEQRSEGRATYVSPGEAMERLRRELGDLGASLAELPENPLPASLELAVPEARRTPERLAQLARETRALPGVSGVDYGEEAVARLSALAAALRYGGLLGFGIVVLATVVIVAATLQLAIYSRREEIEIQKLVGATDRFVKAPFLIEGLLQGLLGAVLAVVALWAFGKGVGPRLGEAFAFLLSPGMPAWLQPRLAVELLACGCALGLGGSFVAVGRFLRV